MNLGLPPYRAGLNFWLMCWRVCQRSLQLSGLLAGAAMNDGVVWHDVLASISLTMVVCITCVCQLSKAPTYLFSKRSKGSGVVCACFEGHEA
jgi:hypothetical protein